MVVFHPNQQGGALPESNLELRTFGTRPQWNEQNKEKDLPRVKLTTGTPLMEQLLLLGGNWPRNLRPDLTPKWPLFREDESMAIVWGASCSNAIRWQGILGECLVFLGAWKKTKLSILKMPQAITCSGWKMGSKLVGPQQVGHDWRIWFASILEDHYFTLLRASDMKSTSNSYNKANTSETKINQWIAAQPTALDVQTIHAKQMPNVLGSGCFCKPVFGKMSPCWNDFRLKRNITLGARFFGAIIPAEICTIENTKLVDISRPWNIHLGQGHQG